MLALAIGPAAQAVQASVTHAQPELVQIAAQQPEQQVAVIVQKAGKGSAAEEMATRLGGKVTRDLHIINAFTAEMAAEAALELARVELVHWVSLDTPVKESGGPDGTVNTANLLTLITRRFVWMHCGQKGIRGAR